MKIIEPKVEFWKQKDPIAHVARCARVCYGNAVSKGKEADKRLYESLKKSGHLSMFRHESVYAIIPHLSYIDDFAEFNLVPYIDVKWSNTGIYVATNKNFLIDHEGYSTGIDLIKEYQVTPEYFAQPEIGHSMMRYTFHITTQISTSRELNRVSPNAIAERSTRYVKENGVICRPHWISKEAIPSNENNPEEIKGYYNFCNLSFVMYKQLLEHNIKREDARGVLPLDTATEVVYTYSVNEWRHIIELRSDKKAHPNCQIIVNMIKKELEKLGYDL